MPSLSEKQIESLITQINALKEENERLRESLHRDRKALREALKEKGDIEFRLMSFLNETQTEAFDFPDTYVVLDLETTGYSPTNAEILEIAAVKYIDDLECDSFVTLVKPSSRIPPAISSLTGIQDEDVSNAPSLSEILPPLSAFLGDFPVVAHNADFDMGFLAEAFERAGIEFSNQCVDTLELARDRIIGMESYSLESLKPLLNLDSQPSHRALPDVYTTAALYMQCKRGGMIAPPELRKGSQKEFRRYKKYPKPAQIQSTKGDIDPNGPLFGKTLVFTGELSIDRSEAMQMAVDVGAIVRTSVSSKTNFLVVGKQDISIVGDDGMSGKEEKAHALNDAGKANIQFINEAEFRRLAQGEAITNG